MIDIVGTGDGDGVHDRLFDESGLSAQYSDADIAYMALTQLEAHLQEADRRTLAADFGELREKLEVAEDGAIRLGFDIDDMGEVTRVVVAVEKSTTSSTTLDTMCEVTIPTGNWTWSALRHQFLGYVRSTQRDLSQWVRDDLRTRPTETLEPGTDDDTDQGEHNE